MVKRECSVVVGVVFERWSDLFNPAPDIDCGLGKYLEVVVAVKRE